MLKVSICICFCGEKLINSEVFVWIEWLIKFFKELCLWFVVVNIYMYMYFRK